MISIGPSNDPIISMFSKVPSISMMTLSSTNYSIASANVYLPPDLKSLSMNLSDDFVAGKNLQVRVLLGAILATTKHFSPLPPKIQKRTSLPKRARSCQPISPFSISVPELDTVFIVGTKL